MENAGNEQKNKPKEFIHKRCLACSKRFKVSLTSALSKMYCAAYCRLTHNRAKLKKCPHCSYVIPRLRRGGWRNRSLNIHTLTCVECGKELVFSKYIPNAYGKRYCNQLCATRHGRKKPKLCPNCGRVIPKSTWGGARHFRITSNENSN